MDMGLKAHVLDVATTVDYSNRDTPMICEDIAVAYSNGLKFYNWTDRDIFVKDRLGYPSRVRSLKPYASKTRDWRYCQNRDTFLVEYSFTVQYEDLTAARQYYASVRGVSRYMEQISDQLNQARNGCDVKITVVTGINMAQFKEGEGSLYFEELGLIMTLDGYQTAHHPESIKDIVRTRLNETVLALGSLGNDSVIVSIEGVDNSGEKSIGNRYVSICNRVHKVPIRYDRTSEHHGIIIRSRPSVREIQSGADPTEVKVLKLSFEEAVQAIGLSRTIEEAEVYGDSKAAFEKKMVEHQQELKLLEQRILEQRRRYDEEQQDMRARQERTRAEFEAETARRAEEKSQREEEASRRKHERDMTRMDKDHRREETRGFMDWLRLAAATLAFAGGVIMGIKKLAA